MKTSRFWPLGLLPLMLMAASLLVCTVGRADHDKPDTEFPLQECFLHVQGYKELSLYRYAGLTIEETNTAIGYNVRVAKYLTEYHGGVYDAAKGDAVYAQAITIYELSDEDFNNDAYMANWATTKFDECIAAIPPEAFAPKPPPINQQQFRMIPDIET